MSRLTLSRVGKGMGTGATTKSESQLEFCNQLLHDPNTYTSSVHKLEEEKQC